MVPTYTADFSFSLLDAGSEVMAVQKSVKPSIIKTGLSWQSSVRSIILSNTALMRKIWYSFLTIYWSHTHCLSITHFYFYLVFTLHVLTSQCLTVSFFNLACFYSFIFYPFVFFLTQVRFSVLSSAVTFIVFGLVMGCWSRKRTGIERNILEKSRKTHLL